jgi:hypothetical protein
MVTLESNGVTINCRATNMSRLYFTQEFKVELDTFMQEIVTESNEQIQVLGVFKILWAMVKAENLFSNTSTPTFDTWINTLDSRFNINDCIELLWQEIENGFTVKPTGIVKESGSTKNLSSKVIACALKMGMSLRDVNELSTQSLLDIISEYAGKDDNESDYATPEETASYFLAK